MQSSLPKTSHWQPNPNGDGYLEGVADIQQCISNILTTPIGSNPTRPDFGSNVHLYLDWPINEARPHIVRETVEAIRKWEPRCTVKRVVVELVDVAAMLIKVFFQLPDGFETSAEVRPR